MQRLRPYTTTIINIITFEMLFTMKFEGVYILAGVPD